MPGRRLKKASESELIAEIGLLAGVFSRSTLEVWVPRNPDVARRVATLATERFGLDEGRVVVDTTRDRKSRTAAIVRVGPAR